MSIEQISTDQNGQLLLGGVNAVELAQKYGTPLYVMDEARIRKAMQLYKTSIDRYYQGNGLPLYASKAFSCKEIYRIAAQEGFGVDVVSGGELATALAAGFDPSKIYFHGNNKTCDELAYAIDSGIGIIVVDNLTELSRIDELSAQRQVKTEVMLRIKPGIDAHTHDYVRTGQIDSKFGFALENGEAVEGVKAALDCKHLNLVGLHCHIGSQIFDTDPFMDAASVMLRFMADLKTEFGATFSKLNLGGGFGIRYTEGDQPLPYDVYMQKVSQRIIEECKALSLDIPYILLEPGRSIVGEAGTTLYTVGSVKEIAGVRNYVAVDGGMADNPRYALYKAEYTVAIANRAIAPKDYIATVAGRCCESGDLIGENMPIQTPKAGDVLAVFDTGAYNYSMASHYNRLPNPAVVFVNDGKDRLAVRRETYEDLYRFDI